jgi:hypothetical protein
MTRTRRSLLQVAAASGAAALAGCSSVIPGSEPAASTSGWLYEPGTVADVDHYLALRYRPATLAERAANFDDQVYDAIQAIGSASRDLVGFDFDETDAQLSFGQNSVIETEFEASDVVAVLESDDFTEGDAYGDFDVYVGPDEGAAVGIGASTVVVARSTGIFGSADNAESVLEAVLDVNAGDAESYSEDSEDFQTLADVVADGDIQSVRTHEETTETDTDEGVFAGEVARGIDSTLVEDGIETTFVRVFNEASDIDDGDVQDWVDASDTFADFESVDVSTDGRIVEVTGTEPTGAYGFYVGDA